MASTTEDHYRRERLVRFCEHHCPEKVTAADALLAKYVGREEDLFGALVKKYGPEPDTALPTPAAAAVGDEGGRCGGDEGNDGSRRGGGGGGDAGADDFRARLVRFYEVHAPHRVPRVDAAVEEWAGREEALFESLVGMYGPEPTGGGGAVPTFPARQQVMPPLQPVVVADRLRTRLVRFFEFYKAEKLSTVDAVMAKYGGSPESEARLFRTLEVKYGPEPQEGATLPPTSPPPPAGTSSATTGLDSKFRDRLVRYFEHYCPSRVPTVDAMVAAYSGRERFLFDGLVSFFGPEALSSAASSEGENNSSSFRNRVACMYARYAPDKQASDVDRVVAKYAGREDFVMRLLASKYGPEPTTISPASGPGVVDSSPPPPQAPAPPAARDNDSTDYAARLARFYEHRNPGKLPNVDMTLIRFAGKEDELFATLVSKYGAEPPPAISCHPPCGEQGGGGGGVMSDVAGLERHPSYRLARFFDKYQPPTLLPLAVILERCAGREEALLAVLVRAYGPEPDNQPPTATASDAPRW